MISSSGLSWWQSWICVWLGYTIAACFVCLTGRIGAKYHISFPVVSRSSFGIWGALWPVLNRAAMACIWYGVQAWIGGECVRLMISAIWPSFTTSPTASQTQAPTLETSYRSSSSGLARSQQSGSQSTRSDISSPSKQSSPPQLASHSSSGP